MQILRPGDLIDDRELVTVDRDRLDHERVAEELVDLVTTVEMPTNIALYGPWGSGKSGIANLVRSKISDNKKYSGVRFARFDAFKYAENPLRRNFIHAVAVELGIQDDKYGKDLYSGKTKTNIDIPDRDKLAISGWFIGLSVALIAALVAVIALLTLLQPGSYWTDFGQNLSAALPAGLIAPAILAAVFTLVGKTLTVDRSVERPDSIEQFEDVFKDLVRDSKAERLVIFVDELDRCTAKEVVATLDAIRTFLGVENCVFVVAADQHVLEQALSEEARQETPEDSVNPYYSTGSAYLDKVFQYQVSLPPLLPQSVTEFAIKAIKNNGGLWKELAPIDYVVSILIPSHVASPRRVKHLLNTFALTYRLAQSKHAAGRLQEDPHVSAQAIARLVCLRVEFPNFARDLTLDPNMPAHVLALLDDPTADLGPRVSPHVRERALAYATGEASPARLLSADSDTEQDGEPGETEGDTANNPPREAPAPESSESGAQAQQGRQLITYLTRTRLIDGPSRDLIYLHSIGSVYGLPDDLAGELSSALDNGQFPETQRLYRNADKADQPKVVQYIAGQITATYGIERLNAAHALLHLSQSETLPNLNEVSDTAGQAIAEMHRSREPVLTEESTPGAWTLSTTSDGDGAATLKRTILMHLNHQTDWNATYLFTAPLLALNADAGSAIRLMARELNSERAPQVVAALKALDHATARRVLEAIGTQAGRELAGLLKQRDAHREASKEAEEAAAAGTADATTPAPPAPEPPVQTVIAALTDLAGHWAEHDPDLSWIITYILLLGDHADSRGAVVGILPSIGQASEHRIVTELLKGVAPRPSADWDSWLASVPSNLIEEADDSLLSSALGRLFSYATDADKARPIDEIKRAIEQLVRLVENRPAGIVDITAEAESLLNDVVTTEAEAITRIWILDRIHTFTQAGFTTASSIALHEIKNMRQTMRAGLPEQPEAADISTYLAMQGPAVAKDMDEHPDDEETEALLGFAQEARQASILSERLRMQTAVGILANGPTDLRDQAREQAPTADEMLAFYAAHGQNAARTLTAWVGLCEPDRTTTQRLIRTAREYGGITEDVALACHEITQTWSPEERLALIHDFIATPDQDVPEPPLLRAIGFNSSDPVELASLLVKRFENSGSNAAKDTVIELWKQAPAGESQAATLYDQILIPWLRLNTNGSTNAEAVRRALHATRSLAVQVPPALRETFADVVTHATDGDNELTKAAIPVLQDLGYSAERVGFFRKRLEVDEHQEDYHDG